MTTEGRTLASHTVRLSGSQLDTARRLVDELGDTPEALAAGGRWGLGSVLRLAVEIGLADLNDRAADLNARARRERGGK